MSAILILTAVVYLAAGRFWWRRIVVPGPNADRPEPWRTDLANDAARGDFACLAAKATFVLLWPLALGAGWLLAQTGGDA